MRRLLHSLNALLLGQVITRLGSFVMIPLYLHYWSPVQYGEWITLFAAVGYLSTLDVGMQVAAVNRLTQLYARGDFASYRRLQSSCVVGYAGLALIGTFVLALILLLAPCAKWLGIVVTPPRTVTIVLLLLGVSVLWSMPLKLIISTYQTMGRLAKSQWINNVQLAVTLMAFGTLVHLGFGMRSLALVQVLSSLAAFIYVSWDVAQHFPRLAFTPRLAKLGEARALLHPSLMFAVMSFSMLLYFQSQTVIVSVMMGGAAVAVFSASRQLATLIRICIDTLCDASVPDICNLSVLDSLRPRVQRFRLLLGASVALTVSLGSFLWWEGGSIVDTWTRHRLAPNPALIRLFVLLSLGQAVWLVAAVFRTALNQNRRTALCYAVSNVSAIPLVIFLVPRLGICAVPTALLMTEAVFLCHPLLADTCRNLQLAYAHFAIKLWTFVLIAFGVVLAAGLGIHLLQIPVLSRWLVSASVCTGVACACTFVLWFRREERGMLRGMFRRTPSQKPLAAAVS